MNIYECDEVQFIENVRRLVEVYYKFVVNRRIVLYDDNRYGLSLLPDKEFEKYNSICYRKGYKHTVYAKEAFFDEFHKKLYNKHEVLHSASSLTLPRLSIPYYKVEYSFSIWGNNYIYTFDVLFKPDIKIEKRRIGSKYILVYTLNFTAPDESMLTIKFPKNVIVLDIKKLSRVINESV